MLGSHKERPFGFGREGRSSLVADQSHVLYWHKVRFVLHTAIMDAIAPFIAGIQTDLDDRARERTAAFLRRQATTRRDRKAKQARRDAGLLARHTTKLERNRAIPAQPVRSAA